MRNNIRIHLHRILLSSMANIFMLSCLLSSSLASEQIELKIGVRAYQGTKMAIKMWQPTIEHLNRHCREYHFKLIPVVDYNQLEEMIANKAVDFIISDPVFYVQCEYRYGVSRIATLEKKRKGLYTNKYGSVIITRADREDIQDIRDLEQKTFMGAGPRCFAGWRMAVREFQTLGINPESFFSRIHFSEDKGVSVVKAVVDGSVDAGTVRTGFLEMMEKKGLIRKADFKILNPKHYDFFPYETSTRTYPEFPFAKLLHVKNDIAEHVLIELLGIQENDNAAKAGMYARWSIPQEYSDVIELMMELDLAPFTRDVGVLEFLRRHLLLTAFVVGCIVLLISLFLIREMKNRIVLNEKQLDAQKIKDSLRTQTLLDLHQNAPLLENRKLYGYALEKAVQITESEIGYLHQIEKINGETVITLTDWNNETLKHCSATFGDHYPLSQAGIWADSIRTKKPVIHNDYPNNPMKKGYPDGHVPVTRHMGVPLVENEFVKLIFGVGNKKSEYNQNDIQQVQLIVNELQNIVSQKRYEAEQKELESRLQHAHKMESVGTMAGGIAHDFNNILYMITGNAEMGMEDTPKWNPVYANLEEIKSAGLRAAGIVKQLLSFSHKIEHEMRPVEAVTVIEDSLKFLRSTMPASMEIQKNLSDIELTILGDPVQIKQALMNIFINASQAMEENGGILKINVEKEILQEDAFYNSSELAAGDYLKITINDEGPGIDPEIIDRIFDPYFTTKGMGEGSGMGLAVVHGIIQNHDGAIFVDSKPGKGSTFTIFLPLEKKAPEKVVRVSDKIVQGSETILFVDDEKAIADMVGKMLKRLGYEVQTTTAPAEAVRLFQAKPDHFDLVITDMTMPRMNGAKLSLKLKEIRSDIPVIICTGHSSLINEEKAKQIGIDDYVTKPIMKRDIAETIRKVLDGVKDPV